ncbi:MAG TPA: GNAT family N-acetyltransferase [Candidatus Cloacimonadota bacterium]|nr:GNAT family N-acetyltransferase [Candidatus Cloacimonadota bacterium]
MRFDLNNCTIRLARPSDTADLEAIARTIWDGTDYLPRIMDRWISEPWFFVCVYEGKVIACIKLSLFPDNVLWIEGLRVHRRFQGKGIATLLNRHIFRFATELKARNPELAFEFCTYYKNAESLHMTEKMGFRIVKRFYQLDKRGVKHTKESEIVTDYDMSLFKAYPDYLPLGWQAVHNTASSLDFIKSRATVFRTPRSTYLLAGVGEKNITFLQPPVQDLKVELPYFQSFFGSRRKYGIVLPPGFNEYLPQLLKLGFYFWEEEHEIAKCMVIGRKD